MSKYVDMTKNPCFVCGVDKCDPEKRCEKFFKWHEGEDVAQVKRGHWVREQKCHYIVCSACGSVVWTFGEFEGVQWDQLDKYCPHCGAKMDEVSE